MVRCGIAEFLLLRGLSRTKKDNASSRVLSCPAKPDLSGDGMNFNTAAAVAHSGPQRMLALLFDHDGDIRPDFPRHCLSRKMKVGVLWHAQPHWARNCIQVPVAVCARIALHAYRTRRSVYLHVALRALNIN